MSVRTVSQAAGFALASLAAAAVMGFLGAGLGFALGAFLPLLAIRFGIVSERLVFPSGEVDFLPYLVIPCMLIGLMGGVTVGLRAVTNLNSMRNQR